MMILVADDHDTNRKLLGAVLSAEGYVVREARDGTEALAALNAASGPVLGLIDWQMPGLTGLEVCREARALSGAHARHLILLTARDSLEDVVAGLDSGASDYITKPFEQAELLARVRLGLRLLELQGALAERVRELEESMAHVKRLQGLLPMCSYCKSIRDDRNYWQRVEHYLATNTDARVSHGVCPACFDLHLKPQPTALGLSEAEVQQMTKPGDSPR